MSDYGEIWRVDVSDYSEIWRADVSDYSETWRLNTLQMLLVKFSSVNGQRE